MNTLRFVVTTVLNALGWEGYIDVGDKWMLVTLSWWQFLDVGDRVSILVTSFGCWCPALMMKDRGCWWQKRPKQSPTSKSCRQHISSPTSVTNIDVAVESVLDWWQIFDIGHNFRILVPKIFKKWWSHDESSSSSSAKIDDFWKLV